jgi:hypothetical protein
MRNVVTGLASGLSSVVIAVLFVVLGISHVLSPLTAAVGFVVVALAVVTMTIVWSVHSQLRAQGMTMRTMWKAKKANRPG